MNQICPQIELCCEGVWHKLTQRLTEINHRNEELALPLESLLTQVRKELCWALEQLKQELKTGIENSTAELLESNAKLAIEITKRKQIETTLRESEEKFRSLVANIPGAIYRCGCDRDWTIKFISDAIAEISGYPAAEFIDNCVRSFASIIHPEDRALVKENILDSVEKKEPYVIEYRIIRSDGRIRWVYEKGQGVFAPNGEILCLDGAIFDITDRKQAEEALRQSEARYRAVVEDRTELICRYLPDGTITFVNNAYCRYFGKTPEDLVGNTFMQLVAPEDFEKLEKYIASFSPENPIATIKHRVVAPNGEIRWQYWSDRVIFDEQGKLIEIQSVGQDITEREQAFEELREREAQYRRIVETAQEGIWIIDAESKTILANNRMAQMVGYTPEEMLGMPLFAFLDGEDREMAAVSVERRRQGIAETVDCRLRRKDGSYLWAIASTNPIFDGSGQYAGALAMLTDITERKQTEEALKQKEEFLQLVLDNIPQYICWKDRNSVYLGGNRNNARLAGFDSPDELVGKTDYDLPWKKEESEFFRECDRRVMENDKAEYHIIESIHKANGVLAWLDTSKIPLHDEKGNVVGILVTIEDITERKQAEEALRKSEATNRALVNAIPDMMLRIRSDGTFVDFKPAKDWPPLLSTEAFLGKKIGEVMPNEVAQQAMYCLEKTLQTGDIESFEYQLEKDGNICNYEARHIAIGEDEILSIVRDITDRKQMEEALRSSEERYRRIVETTSEGVCIIDADNKATFANNRMAQMLGYQLSEIIGMSVFDLIHEADRERAAANLERRRLGIEESHDLKFRHKDGSYLWALISASPIFDRSGQYVGALKMVTDITERKQAEEAVIQSRQMLQLVIDNIPQFIFWKDRNSVYLGCNRNFAEVAGLASPDNIVGLTDYDLPWRKEETEFFRECDRRVMEINSPEYHIIEPLRQADGKESWVDTNKIPLHDAGGNVVGILATYEDITERRLAQETIQYQATHDLLTGLPNRRLFNEKLLLALENVRETGNILAVMFLDLDRFKTINDTLGHAVGDRLLEDVAARLKGCLRCDDILARWGGDEFTLLLPQIVDVEDAAKIAQRILEVLHPAFDLDGHQLHITSSIGIALSPCDGLEIETILKNADAALYRAKEQGRNNYQFYNAAMNSQASELLVLENELHQALNRGEFVLHYQPQINSKTNQITGMEALLR